MNQLIKELPGLVAWYPHTEGSGSTLNDYSGNGNNGTISNGTWRKSVDGFYALEYNGSSTLTTLGSTISAGTTHTISLWIKFDAFGDVLGGDGADLNVYWGFFSDSSTFFYIPGAGNVATFNLNQTLSTDTWYMLTITRNNTTTVNVYINGEFDNSSTLTTNSSMNIRTIGGRTSGETLDFDGQIKNFIVSTSSWSPELINQIYRKTFIQ